MKQPELPAIGDKTDVAKHRLRVAKEDLQAANLLLEANSYRGAKTGHIMRFSMQYQQYWQWKELLLKNIKIRWHILIKIM